MARREDRVATGTEVPRVRPGIEGRAPIETVDPGVPPATEGRDLREATETIVRRGLR